MRIPQLSTLSSIDSATQFVAYDPSGGIVGRVSVQELLDLIDGETPSSILDISSIFALRENTGGAVAVGTSYQNLVNWDQGLAFLSDRTAFTASASAGEFIATRDILGIECQVSIIGTWPTNRDLTATILVGADASLYETALTSVVTGRGGGAYSTITLNGKTANFNDPEFKIRAGQKVKLQVKFNTSDTLTLTRAAFVVQTLDGI